MANNICLSAKKTTGEMEIMWTGGIWPQGPVLAML